MKRVEYACDVAKMLQRMDRATARRIRDKVRQYAEDPASLANNVIVMNGNEALRRMRIGDWRVIFNEDLVVVLVIRVAPRGGTYD